MGKEKKYAWRTVINMNKQQAWEQCANRVYGDKRGNFRENAPLGVRLGGCPNCGHLCDFNDETYICIKCDWNWKDEK